MVNFGVQTSLMQSALLGPRTMLRAGASADLAYLVHIAGQEPMAQMLPERVTSIVYPNNGGDFTRSRVHSGPASQLLLSKAARGPRTY
jgi:hypothetical protein